MRRRHHLTGVLACAVLLTGCGGTPDASAPATARPAASPSSVATPSPPTLPGRVQLKDEGGAVAAARAFVEAMTYSGRTGDVGPLRLTFADTCTGCQALADEIEGVYSRGDRIRGGEWVPSAVTVRDLVGDTARVDVVVDSIPRTIAGPSGAEVQQGAAQTRALHVVELSWTGEGGWTVSALDPQP